ncbi:MAG: uracil-DNA glycosylase [Candidatus Aenigmarchaeota archaeon]|nr:uracil-DNA glycosylase [Candidatus Aenigmarchaeota archaeon]
MSLEEIRKEIEKCEECKRNKYGLPVPGEGNPKAKIFFIGEAPGPTESKTGKPFVGKAGKFLTKLLSSVGIKREEVFITSTVKYYPGRRALTLEEIKHGMTHTFKQIEAVNPRVIVLLGNTALKAFFPKKKLKVSEVHGKVLTKGDKICFPTFHPSAAMRFPETRKLVEKDMKKLKNLLKSL